MKLFEKERNVLELIVSRTFGCRVLVKELWLIFTLFFYKTPLAFIFVNHNDEYIPGDQLTLYTALSGRYREPGINQLTPQPLRAYCKIPVPCSQDWQEEGETTASCASCGFPEGKGRVPKCIPPVNPKLCSVCCFRENPWHCLKDFLGLVYP